MHSGWNLYKIGKCTDTSNRLRGLDVGWGNVVNGVADVKCQEACDDYENCWIAEIFTSGWCSVYSDANTCATLDASSTSSTNEIYTFNIVTIDPREGKILHSFLMSSNYVAHSNQLKFLIYI